MGPSGNFGQDGIAHGRKLKILAIDSATTACSAAVWAEGAVLAHALEPTARGQAERLMPMIEAVMRRAGLDYPALDLMAVTVGPGAFTGLRVGLATARGLALATGCRLVGFTTLETVAFAVPEPDRPLLVALESRRAEVHTQLFGDGLAALGPPEAKRPEEWAGQGPFLLAGDAADRLEPYLTGGVIRSRAAGCPDAAFLAHLAAVRADSALPPAPLYLRAPDVTLAPS